MASQLAVQTMREFFEMTDEDPERTWPYKMDHSRGYEENRLVTAIKLSNLRIFETAQSNHKQRGMGTTMVAIFAVEDGIHIAHVGDSRVYLWQKSLRQISHDHSLVQELVATGMLDAAQATRHPQRNVITQALGITAPEQLHIGMARGRLEPGMCFLLCSDGLTEEVSDAAMASVVSRQDLSAQECVEHLLLAALDGGGSDNITTILARIN